MIPLWLANSGEDFKIEKFPDNMLVVTAETIEFKIKSIVFAPLPVIGKGHDTIYIAFAGKRLAIIRSRQCSFPAILQAKQKRRLKLRVPRLYVTTIAQNARAAVVNHKTKHPLLVLIFTFCNIRV